MKIYRTILDMPTQKDLQCQRGLSKLKGLYLMPKGFHPGQDFLGKAYQNRL